MALPVPNITSFISQYLFLISSHFIQRRLTSSSQNVPALSHLLSSVCYSFCSECPFSQPLPVEILLLQDQAHMTLSPWRLQKYLHLELIFCPLLLPQFFAYISITRVLIPSFLLKPNWLNFPLLISMASTTLQIDTTMDLHNSLKTVFPVPNPHFTDGHLGPYIMNYRFKHVLAVSPVCPCGCISSIRLFLKAGTWSNSNFLPIPPSFCKLLVLYNIFVEFELGLSSETRYLV